LNLITNSIQFNKNMFHFNVCLKELRSPSGMNFILRLTGFQNWDLNRMKSKFLCICSRNFSILISQDFKFWNWLKMCIHKGLLLSYNFQLPGTSGSLPTCKSSLRWYYTEFHGVQAIYPELCWYWTNVWFMYRALGSLVLISPVEFQTSFLVILTQPSKLYEDHGITHHWKQITPFFLPFILALIV
jgi:hypothetical protein